MVNDMFHKFNIINLLMYPPIHCENKTMKLNSVHIISFNGGLGLNISFIDSGIGMINWLIFFCFVLGVVFTL